MPKAKPRHRHSQTCNCAQYRARLFTHYGRIFKQFETICLHVIENFAGFTTQTKFDIIKETQACLIRANRIVGWTTIPKLEPEQLPYRLMIRVNVFRQISFLHFREKLVAVNYEIGKIYAYMNQFKKMK